MVGKLYSRENSLHAVSRSISGHNHLENNLALFACSLLKTRLTVFLVSSYVECLFMSCIQVVFFLNRVACLFILSYELFKYSESPSFVT